MGSANGTNDPRQLRRIAFLGGSVLVHSATGQGSRFVVSLPESPPAMPTGDEA